ncbi:MAG: protein YgfX [Pseudomonadota bacterium]
MNRTIEFQPGRWGRILIVLIAGLALLAIAWSGIAPSLKLLSAACLIGWSFWCYCAWPVERRWRSLRLLKDGQYELVDRKQNRLRVEALNGAFLSPFFVSFTLQTPHQRRIRVYGFFDQFERDDFRCLLLNLRFRAS